MGRQHPGSGTQSARSKPPGGLDGTQACFMTEVEPEPSRYRYFHD